MTATKPSGISWIGSIPSDWEIKKIKYISTLKGRIGWQGLTSEEYTDEGAYLITGTDFDNGRINWETCVHVPMKRWEEAKDIQIENGDLLITKDGTVGKVAIVDGLESPCSLNSGVLRISTKNGYDRRFLFWVLQSEVFWTWFSIKNAGNSTILHLYQGDFAEFNYAIPPLPEQQAITTFLYNQCVYIDGIIADLERQLEILRKYKKALITEMVTKGLDKSAPMKDSGIDWIGEIPRHWDLKKLKLLASFHNGDRGENYPLSTEIVSEGIPFINAGHLTDGRVPLDNMDFITPDKYKFMGGVKLRCNDILYCLRGSIGKNAIIDFDEGTVASSLVAIRCFACVPKYAFYCLNSVLDDEQRFFYDNGTAQPNLAADSLRKFRITYPPVEEQKAIANWLDVKCAEADALIAEKQLSVETMRQYKRSLIYEYVTGKKRVVG